MDKLDIRAKIANGYYDGDNGINNLMWIELKSEFEHDLSVVYGVRDGLKASQFFSRAWDDGHLSGLDDVMNYYGRYAELIKD